MSKLVWKDEYCIGHYQIDYEHKKLISLANKVIGFSNVGENITNIRQSLKALCDYTKIHFRNEESYMARIGFKEIEHHKACHAELIQRINETVRHQTNRDDLVHRLKRLMVVWVIEHIIHEDKRIEPNHYRSKPARVDT